ncbi:hypothetical protein SARC_00094 [Sphaeroforma arctica JP610]|uniref:Uncharacterized protein n=1 Tax=Sphaeroforma arctica JP610 TaxID=667725 RepID=A0A0L0GFN1_9EUKA|nr:hypothetical protein SARC_00094 [Sphaeroforma arctica JP610]KNC87837.1 hypothetical protein SARC_00094 [Sphaeroforma arctica JP610]|eukprot:XP_014161739.1 hypothetical protein SARC_00094 [Sphaeroforma arctica JP610]
MPVFKEKGERLLAALNISRQTTHSYPYYASLSREHFMEAVCEVGRVVGESITLSDDPCASLVYAMTMHVAGERKCGSADARHVLEVYMNSRETFNKLARDLVLPDRIPLGYFGSPANATGLVCLTNMDRIILEHGNQSQNDGLGWVYRAVPPSLVETITLFAVTQQEEFHAALLNFAFTSCTTDLEVASRLVSRDRGCCVLAFQIPEEVNYFDGRVFNTMGEGEIIIQRNTYFSNFQKPADPVNGITVVECTLDLLQRPLSIYISKVR